MSEDTLRRMRGSTVRQRRLAPPTRDMRRRPLPAKHGHAARPQATRAYQSDTSSKQRPCSSISPRSGAGSPRPPPVLLDNRSLHISAVVNATRNKVVLALHIDASAVEAPNSVSVPADSVTEGLANVRGVVHDTIEVRITSPWSITRNGQAVSIELIRIVPGANLVEVDEDAGLATTTHGLSGYEVTISQTDGSTTHSTSGVLGPANLALITDAALDNLVVGRDTTIAIGPPIAPPPAALSRSGVPTAPAGTLRFKGHGVDLTITNGEWSGTPLPGARAQVPGARGQDGNCGWEEREVCVRHPAALLCTLCRFTPPLVAVPCIVVCLTLFVVVCHLYFEFVCVPPPPVRCPPHC